MKSERNHGIDLLRLILMYMVCVLHTLGRGGVLATCVQGTAAYNSYWLIETLSFCAVDGFAIISGYCAVDRPPRYEKLVNMWFQAFFYSFVVTLLFAISGLAPEWKTAHLIRAALPVTFGQFWYFTAYFALFFLTPILNPYLFSIDKRNAKRAVLLLFVLFSCMESFGNVFKAELGYSPIWLMVLYCIGALAKQGEIFEHKKSLTLIFLWIACIVVTWIGWVFFGISRLLEYVSPTVLTCGLIMVVLFSRLQMKRTFLLKLSPFAFAIYLFQLNPVIWDRYLNGACSFIVQTPIAVGIACVFAIAACIFISGLVVEFIRVKLANILRIPALSKKIVSFLNLLLQKFLFVLN